MLNILHNYNVKINVLSFLMSINLKLHIDTSFQLLKYID